MRIDQNVELKTGQHADYQVLVPLEQGKGAHGIVFKAKVTRVKARLPHGGELEEGQLVVVKTPPTLDEAVRQHEIYEWLTKVWHGYCQEERAWLSMKDAAPRVPRFYDMGLHFDETQLGGVRLFFCVQELVVGQSLELYFSSRQSDFRGVAEPGEFFRFARKLIVGLMGIHQAGVVHGDISPQNILVEDTASRYCQELCMTPPLRRQVS